MNERAAFIWALKNGAGLSVGGRLVLLTVTVLATRESDFFVSRDAVIAATGISKRHVKRIWHELEVAGLISCDSREANKRTYYGRAWYRAACFDFSTGTMPQSQDVLNAATAAPAC
jgi:hypothetical protein